MSVLRKFASIIKKSVNRLNYMYARTSPKRYENFLRKKGCRIGTGIYWTNVKTVEVDYSRPTLIEIGNNVKINNHVTLLTHDAVSWVFRNKYHDFVSSSGAVKIGNNVYIGRHSTILKGVTIGDNCVIGYGSLVTKDIPSNSVAAGVPAKVLCDIDTYYRKRKSASLEEAFAYARNIVSVTGRKPTVEEMYEEFPFYLDGNVSDKRLKIPVEYQTRGFYDEWKAKHKAPYKNFDEFLKAAGIEL